MIDRSPILDLANRIQMTFVAVAQVVGNWVPYLLDPNLDREIQLRNKAFAITINGLTDACENYDTKINDLRVRAKKLGSERALHYITIVEAYIEGAIDVLSVFSRNEMIYIIEHRHQFVHGHLANMHSSTRKIKYVKDRHIVSTKISDDDYWNSCRSIENGRDLDTALIELRRKFYTKPTLFWRIDDALRNKDTQSLIYRDIQTPQPDVPLVVIQFHPKGYWHTVEEFPVYLMNLYQVSDFLTYPGPTDLDPVLHSKPDRLGRRVAKKLLVYGWFRVVVPIFKASAPPQWILEFLRR